MIRFAVLGYGFIGAVHAAVLKKIKGAQLVGVIEQDTDKWQAAVKGNISVEGADAPLDVPFFRTLEELTTSTPVDCLSICLPTHLHRDHAVRVLSAGLHVVCEKPMALTLADCNAMLEAARRHNRSLFIAQCIRFWPEYEMLKAIYDTGELGALVSLRLHRLSGMPSWGGPQAWFFDERKSGGCLFDLHVHDLDFIHHLLGRPRAVYSQGTSLDNGLNASVLTQYDFDGITCCAEGSWCCHSGFRMTFSAVFENGQLEYDSSVSPALRLWRRGNSEPECPKVPNGDGYERQYLYFIDCLQKGVPPTRMTPESARQSIEIALAEKRSMSERRVIGLDE